jgi:hypothetical protein
MQLEYRHVVELVLPPEIELSIFNECHLLSTFLQYPRILRHLLQEARREEYPRIYFFTHWTLDPKGLYVDPRWTYQQFEEIIERRVEKLQQPLYPFAFE